MAKKKFKAIEKDAKDAPTKDIQWEGEEITAESQTKIESDTGTGQEVILRFFQFAANPQTFKEHKPTAQELFNQHRNGIESLMWSDGLAPFEEVQPRLTFSKDGAYYRFIVACIPAQGNTLVDKTRTLSELLTNSKN